MKLPKTLFRIKYKKEVNYLEAGMWFAQSVMTIVILVVLFGGK